MGWYSPYSSFEEEEEWEERGLDPYEIALEIEKKEKDVKKKELKRKIRIAEIDDADKFLPNKGEEV